MTEAFYLIIVLVVGVLAAVKGFGKGFTGQVSGILGFAFGAVCAHIFGGEAAGLYRSLFPGLREYAGGTFVYSVLGAVTVYVIVFYSFKALTGILRSAMEVFGLGMLDQILGAAFSLVKYLLALSIVFNLILCVKPDCALMKYATSDDGNIVEGVIFLAPGLLGCFSAEDLAHLLQLREARKISLADPGDGDINITRQPLVITYAERGYPAYKHSTQNA